MWDLLSLCSRPVDNGWFQDIHKSNVLNNLPMCVTVTDCNFKVFYQNILSEKKYKRLQVFDAVEMFGSRAEASQIIKSLMSNRVFYQSTGMENNLYNHVFVAKIDVNGFDSPLLVYVEFIFVDMLQQSN